MSLEIGAFGLQVLVNREMQVEATLVQVLRLLVRDGDGVVIFHLDDLPEGLQL